jgi:hypothetical protein
MRHKYFHQALLILVFMLLGVVAAFAQSGPMRGVVVTNGADGKETPVADAQVDVYRTDLPGTFNTKTNKKGEFVFAGLPFIGSYVIAVSAPGMSPNVEPGANVKDPERIFKITLGPGDGKRLTATEAKTLAKGGGGSPSAGSGGGGGESAEDKKKREEYEKQKAEVESKNKKIEETNTLYRNAFKNGNDALTLGLEKAKNNARAEAIQAYTTAITTYNEPLGIDPEHPAAPVILRNRGLALKSRAITYFNNYVSSKPEDAERTNHLQAARQDLRAAVASFNQSLAAIKANPGEDPTSQANNNKAKTDALTDRYDTFVLYFTKIKDDGQEMTNRLDEGYAAIQEYMAVEIDPAKKAKARLELAGIVFETANLTYNPDLLNRTLAEYQKILGEQPDDPDALVRSGMTLFNIGALSNDKAKYQEAANFLQRFVDKAPDTHPFKKDAADILDNLKKEQNIKAEKGATPKKRP